MRLGGERGFTDGELTAVEGLEASLAVAQLGGTKGSAFTASGNMGSEHNTAEPTQPKILIIAIMLVTRKVNTRGKTLTTDKAPDHAPSAGSGAAKCRR